MFTRPSSDELTITFAGRTLSARPGDTIASVLLVHGIYVTRSTAASGSPRGPYCMMGACFECLAVVDGRPDVQTCLTPVRDGMVVRPQDGARALTPAA